MAPLKERIVFITGASSGIGRATALLLAEKGAVPVLTARSREKLEQLSREIAQRFPGIIPPVIPLDVTSEREVEDGVRQIIERYGRIDILINNAGYGLFKSVSETTLEEFADMMNTNFMGTVRCTKAVLPSMLARGQGHIINVASVAGLIATAKFAGYTATKHAVVGFTNSLRQELRGTGIAVSLINPGPVETSFFARADQTGEYLARVKHFMIKAEQVAHAIVSLCASPRKQVIIPGYMGIGVKGQHLFPNAMERFLHKFVNPK